MKRVIFTLLVIAVSSIPAFSKYSGGTGDPNTPYQIANVADLMTLANDANDYNKCFVMTADIDLDPCLPSNQVFTAAVIAWDICNTNYRTFDGNSFTGIFDGAGHKIRNLTIDTNGVKKDYVGLFGYVNGGQIQNIHLENFRISDGNDSNFMGGLAGYMRDTNISNCSASGAISGGTMSGPAGGFVGEVYNCDINNCFSTGYLYGCGFGPHQNYGGLVGYMYQGSIINSYSTDDVNVNSGAWYAGGFIGFAEYGTIRNCYATGTVSFGSSSIYIGGFVGESYTDINMCFSSGNVNQPNGFGAGGFGGFAGGNYANITNSYSTGDVIVFESGQVGGFIGRNCGVLINCFSTGSVSAGTLHGGLIGLNYSGSIYNSYYLSGAGPNNGLGTPLTDAQMRQQASFVGWDFNNVWTINEGVDYPKLLFLWTGKYSGGTGDPCTPYRIANVADLLTLANDINDYNKCFILTADIDLDPCLPGGQVFTTAVIASDMNNKNRCVFDGNVFTGVFDGAGHKIYNLTLINPYRAVNDYLGLFGDVNGGQIKNLGLQNVSITGGYDSNYLGALVGYNEANLISNCYSTGLITNASCIGGLVGYHHAGDIRNSYSTCSVTGGGIMKGSFIGGLVGYSDTNNLVSSCYATGDVNGWSNLGGLVGYNRYNSTIINCYSTGNIIGQSGSMYLGGLVGCNQGGDRGAYIINCYSTGSVAVGTYHGGLVGYNSTGGALVMDSYFLSGAGPNNGYGAPLTDTQMKQQASFVGWDFNSIWRICEAMNYPRLLWQIPAGDWVCPAGANFVDYSFFTNRWMNTNCAANNDCDGTDFDSSGTVDLADLKVFCNNWLQGL